MKKNLHRILGQSGENINHSFTYTRKAHKESLKYMAQYNSLSRKNVKLMQSYFDCYTNALTFLLKEKKGKLEICVRFPRAKVTFNRFSELENVQYYTHYPELYK